jgi:AraC-like DNA-binding protein
VAVSARSVKDLPVAASNGLVDMRVGLTASPAGWPVRAGSFVYDGGDLVTGWHHHDLHQLEYALEGTAEVETEASHHLLPPQQAIWIPAGLAHNTTLRGVRSVSVFFEPSMVAGVDDRARVLAAAPVIREMIGYARRWPIDRPESDPTADAFFDALALLARDWLEHEAPLHLPTSTDPVVRDVMAYSREHLGGVTIGDACAAVGISERSLRRRFAATTGMTWRQYVLESRLLRAISLLTEPGRTVLAVATDVGFDSVSAFTRAFARYAGETPSAYRRRVRRPSNSG